MKKLTFIISLLLLPLVASADPVEINGIWYNLVTRLKTAEVIKNPDANIKYSGSIDIPATISCFGNIVPLSDEEIEQIMSINPTTLTQQASQAYDLNGRRIYNSQFIMHRSAEGRLLLA